MGENDARPGTSERRLVRHLGPIDVDKVQAFRIQRGPVMA